MKLAPMLLLPKDKLMTLHTATIRSIHCNLTTAVDIEPTLVTRIIRNYGMGVTWFANYGAIPPPQNYIGLPADIQVDVGAPYSGMHSRRLESSSLNSVASGYSYLQSA